MKFFFCAFVLVLVFSLISAAPAPAGNNLRASDQGSVVGKPTCTGKAIVEKDCNRALLALGGGIAGKIQFLRPGTSSTTGKFGTCLITTTSQNAKAVVDVSKGRLEAAYRVLLSGCGKTTGSVVISGGSSSGNTLLSIA
ncbi:hypothetical protein HK096_010004 [Nowakowskiella sp. JEL0078]|nr:hypothetical protein HK096_010004 [Nowakowskiella sp. JEL0078]